MCRPNLRASGTSSIFRVAEPYSAPKNVLFFHQIQLCDIRRGICRTQRRRALLDMGYSRKWIYCTARSTHFLPFAIGRLRKKLQIIRIHSGVSAISIAHRDSESERASIFATKRSNAGIPSRGTFFVGAGSVFDPPFMAHSKDLLGMQAATGRYISYVTFRCSCLNWNEYFVLRELEWVPETSKSKVIMKKLYQKNTIQKWIKRN